MTHTSARAVRALVGIHFSRLYKSVLSAASVIIALGALRVAKHGWDFDALLPFILGGAIALPAMVPFTLVREKFDGSLRYLASLPVAGTTHAIARLTIALIMCFPSAVAIGVALHVKASMPIAILVPTVIGALLFMCCASLALLAFQIRAKVGLAMTYIIYCFLALFGLMNAVQFAVERGWVAALRPILLTPAGLALTSLAVWVGFLAVGWWGFRSIARSMVSYRGEPAEV